jgi:hypothetical protein
MQAIITKYIGPTNIRGSRIRAFCEGGSITIGYPHELSGEDVYRKAAVALCERLGWTAEKGYSRSIAPDFSNLIGGVTKTGYVFTFAPIDEARVELAKMVRFVTCAPDRYTSMNPYGRPEVRSALRVLGGSETSYDAAETTLKAAGIAIPYLTANGDEPTKVKAPCVVAPGCYEVDIDGRKL